jgi:hypothetical protein
VVETLTILLRACTSRVVQRNTNYFAKLVHAPLETTMILCSKHTSRGNVVDINFIG